LKEDENLFVDNKGEWKGYVPSVVRTYPFFVAKDDEKYSLVIDSEALKKYTLSNKSFFHNNELTQEAKRIISFVEQVYTGLRNAKKSLNILYELGLLNPVDVSIKTSKNTFALKGFYAVDIKKLHTLKEQEIVNLFQKEILYLIHLHLCSLSNFDSLAEVVKR